MLLIASLLRADDKKSGGFDHTMPPPPREPTNQPTNQISHPKVGKYLELIRRRACGEVLTTAGWIRGFVQRHPEYQVGLFLVSRMGHCMQ